VLAEGRGRPRLGGAWARRGRGQPADRGPRRGRRRVAATRKNVRDRNRLLLPCPYATPLNPALGPAPAPGFGSPAPGPGRRSPRRGAGGGVAVAVGLERDEGRVPGWAFPRRAGEGGGSFALGARCEDKGLGSATNMMVSTLPMMVSTLIGYLSCSLIHPLLPRRQANRSTFTKRRDYPTIVAGMVRDQGQRLGGWGCSGHGAGYRHSRQEASGLVGSGRRPGGLLGSLSRSQDPG
jgi:hypothetical protein